MTTRQENAGHSNTPMRIVLVITLFALCAFITNRDSVLKIVGIRNETELALRQEFADFASDWGAKSVSVDDHPKLASRREIIEWVYNEVPSRTGIGKHIYSGLDSWGTPIVVLVLERKVGKEIEARLIVRSNGPNRLDEAGRADDIELRSSPIFYVDRSDEKR